MTFQVPQYIRSLVPYVPGKPIEETQREFQIKKVIKLASNENPLGPSPKAKAAIRKYLKELHRYPDGAGYRLKQALSKKLNISPQSIIVGNGSNEIIDLLIRTFCVPGDAMVTSEAAFVAYKICAQIHGVQTIEAQLGAELKFNPVEIAAAVKKCEKANIVFIANPNNPTGTYLDSGQLKSLLRELSSIRDGSVCVVLDYAYWEYVTASDLPNPLDLIQEYPNCIVLKTFSKIYGLAGLRLGYGVASPEMIGLLEKVRQPFNVNSLALVGGEAALADTVFVNQSRKLNQRGMKFWEKQLSRMSIPFWKSQGNFLLADVREGLGKSGMEVYESCLRKGVIFRPVANYGLPHALRITIGTPEENEQAVQALNPNSKKLSQGKKKL